MADTLDFIQIIYDDCQREELYDFARPYFNETLTPYFENSVIADIVPSLLGDYISVCSWRLRRKRGDCQQALKNDLALTTDKIFSSDADVMVLTPRSPAHRPLFMAVNWHGRAWVDAFADFKSFLGSLGVKVPDELRHTVYENHFIARRAIYHDYVLNYLRPSIAYMATKEVYSTPSGYLQKKRNSPDIKIVQSKLGTQDWPIAPFILERLFSIYLEGKNLNIKPL